MPRWRSCCRCATARLQVLLWERAREPFAGSWSLPGGYLAAGETLEESIRRHLAAKVDVRELSHLEQLETLQRSRPRIPLSGSSPPPTSGLVPSDVDPAVPADTRWHPVDALPPLAFDHGRDRARRPRAAAREALVHEPRLRARARGVHDLRAARPLRGRARPRRLGDEPAARAPAPRRARAHRGPPRAGPRRAAGPPRSIRFRSRALEITDQFAVLRPPGT